jgi:hypothetical protein
MYSTDHHDRSNVSVEISGANSHMYYMDAERDEVEFGIALVDFETVCGHMDKTCQQVSLYAMRDTFTTTLMVKTTRRGDITEDCIEHSSHFPTFTSDIFTKFRHVIQFECRGAYFKSLVTTLRSSSKDVNFEQDKAENPIIINYVSKNKKVESRRTLNAVFTSTLADDDIFHMEADLDYIKPVVGILPSDQMISVFLNEDGKMKIQCSPDPSMTVISCTECYTT